jgi:uncharacterized membrane protein
MIFALTLDQTPRCKWAYADLGGIVGMVRLEDCVYKINIHSIPGLTAQAAIAAMAMTAWDVVMDPGMAAAGNWIWENGGGYFGVPLHNYL